MRLFADGNTIKFYIFYSEDCELCHDILENYLPEIEPYYTLEYKKFEIGDEKNLELLDKLERQYKSTAEIPEIFIGKYLIGGNDIKEKLETILDEYSQTGCDYPKLKETKKEKHAEVNKTVYIAYFYKKGCKLCDKAYYNLKILKKRYPNIVIKEFNMNLKNDIKMSELLCDYYNVPPKKHLVTPMIFIGDTYFIGKNININKLDEAIQNTKANKAPWEKVGNNTEKGDKILKKRFASFGVFTIALAGLVDGINPCAFATIIFFISYLAILGRKGKDILIVGISYSVSVFLTYYFVGMLGLNILDFLQRYLFLSLVTKIIFLITAVVVLIFSLLSLYDYYLYKKNRTSDMVMQLPLKIKQRIHKYIREKSKIQSLVLASVFIGFLVSLEELFCTGQVYLPTLMYMSKMPQYQGKAFLYLLLYNILFILPLIIVFLAVYFGVKAKLLSKNMEKNLGKLKLLMAIVFFILGIVLIYSVL